ncbi:MAG: Lon protease [Nitrospirae bacterium]|nr:MAG: putative ATP-dependent protease [Nitrospira sp. OLB3]MBV6471377.1 Lon protease [Nitrospirota bacterium]MCE7966530.1 ATP-binding protein [Nitrospira sp. NTP2]MCK6492238.1 AAA family ATPase [Nitrospira sp.]MEB2339080.1 ATP-binding protein [Nitrospirales bacterium]
MSDKHKLPASLLAPTIDPGRLGFEDTSEIEPLDETIGQERAVEALEFGLQMKSVGFNIFVSGPVGTGKGTLVRQMVKRMAQSAPPPSDLCYVHNFQDASRPICLAFPAGQGAAFKREMGTFIEGLRHDIPAAFEGKKYLDAKAKIIEETEGRKKALFHELTKLCRERGFGFEETPVGFGLVPLKNDRPMSEKDMEELSEQAQESLTERRKSLESDLREFHVRMHALEREAEQGLHHLDRQIVANVMQGAYETLQRTYQALKPVTTHLQRVHHDIIHQYKDFLPHSGPILPIPGLEQVRRPDMTRFAVNLIVSHDATAGAPVVEEPHPTYGNLIGKIERRAHLGVMYTDFTEIKAGAMLQANGGYLILQALDVLRQPFTWDALKRVIKTGAVTIEDPGEFYGFATAGLRPEPIPVSVKVILVGTSMIYHLLQAYEEDFSKLFKVKADFDVEVPHDERQERQYARFIAKLCREESLPHFGADAVAEVIRQGFRFADRHDRLSLRFSLVSDLIREAGYWAKKDGHSFVTRADVESALDHQRHRADLPEQWIQDEIREGTLMVDLQGEVVGQVNGLSVYQLGDYAFGRPTRITARTYVGTKGLIDIQREVELAGEIHSKGVMTLAGFLAGKFAGTQPFALSATLTFEQTYSEVEGDSAAVAELTAVLSSLANLPIRQALAVTGSVNQLGEIQPIGGVNEKIEGFFESCRRRGLTGSQGVIIPSRNIKHLALNRKVVEAVEAGLFTVYAVDTIEDALELLTGVPAGERGPDGLYPHDSVYGRTAARLAEMAQIVACWGEGEGDTEKVNR